MHCGHNQVLDSLVVRISACHVEGLYSIPGRGDFVCLRCAVGSASVSLSEDCEFEPHQGKHFKKKRSFLLLFDYLSFIRWRITKAKLHQQTQYYYAGENVEPQRENLGELHEKNVLHCMAGVLLRRRFNLAPMVFTHALPAYYCSRVHRRMLVSDKYCCKQV